jgi:hypothetical protein
MAGLRLAGGVKLRRYNRLRYSGPRRCVGEELVSSRGGSGFVATGGLKLRPYNRLR